MKGFHTIAGLPRAGSTLLCNILNQNPDFKASSTSPISGIVAGLTTQFGALPEIKGELARDKEKTEEKLHLMLRSIIDSWYREDQDKIVFDKSRAWNYHVALFQELYPEGKVICMVRDLRGIAGSIEKQHLKTILLNTMGQQAQTLEQRANVHFAPDGVVGGPLVGLKDILERDYKNVLFVQYEDLVTDPKGIMEGIHEFLGFEPFEYDFEDVKATAVDPDYLYDYKFPHEGSGKVEAKNLQEYKKYIPGDLGKALNQNYGWYFQKFEYGA